MYTLLINLLISDTRWLRSQEALVGGGIGTRSDLGRKKSQF